MRDQAVAITPDESFTFEPQDRKPRLSWVQIASMLLSLAVIAAAIYQLRNVPLADIGRLVPSSPVFWALFAVSYLAGTCFEWAIFRKLWNIGLAGFVALLRKLIYNELLLGYLGEAYFYGWARKHHKIVATPFGAVKDVAVLSAVAGNAMTLVLLALAFPFLQLLPLEEHASAAYWSLAFVLGTSLVIMLWRNKIFSLERGELWMVFGYHILRIVVTTFLSAALWHFVLPDIPLGWWVLLGAIRLLISRLPFVPNKDVVFSGVAVLAVGAQADLAALMAMMAGLILLAHLLTGLTIGLADLIHGARSDEADIR